MPLKGKIIGKHARALALVLAVVVVVFLTQVTVHTHANGQDETTCQVCQAAHLGPVLPSGTLLSAVGPLPVGYVEPFVVSVHGEFFFRDSPSRAPPSLAS